MKRASLIFCLGITVSLFSGCSSVDSCLEKVFLERSGIQADDDYLEYTEMEKNNQLGEDGVYVDTDIFDASETIETTSGVVHVTFANNRYLTIKYYSDANCTEQIDTEDCFLNPGDTIYASAESKNPNSNLYGIESYRICEYDNDNVKKNEVVQKATSTFVYQIPADFSGTELSIIPIGEYSNRPLSMSSFYIDDSGNRKSLTNAGTWLINEEECTGDSVSISPIVHYALKYDFDERNYFFVSSSPKCFTESPDEAGFVEFWEADPTDEDLEYTVELHPYLQLTVSFTASGTVKLNSNEPTSIKKGKSWNSSQLKYGDTIVIETSGECKLTAGDYAHVKIDKDPISDGSRYTLKIVAEAVGNSSDVISRDEYVEITLPATAAHGTCTYKLDGKKVSGTITMQESQKLTITYEITDDDYKFSYGIISDGWNKIQDLMGNMSETAEIEVTTDMNDATIDPDEYFTIIKKGE